MTELLRAEGIVKEYFLRRSFLRAPSRVRVLAGVDLAVDEGECVAVVGESGSGKTTLGRILVRLLAPDSGQILFQGEDLSTLRGEALRVRRRGFQMVFQDPNGSLNPRMRIGRALLEPLQAHGLASAARGGERVMDLLDRVGLDRDLAMRYPHQLSGGQRQRVAIARALTTEPRLLVADEPVSALDVSVRAQILNLLSDLRETLKLALVFISHDLSVVERVADRISVLYMGRVVESAARSDLFAHPQHPYTQSLLAAVPVTDPKRRHQHWDRLVGEPPSLLRPPAGCPFHPRCPAAADLCRREPPEARSVRPGHEVSCHFPGLPGHSVSKPGE